MADMMREALAKRLSEITAGWPQSEYLSLVLHKEELAFIIRAALGEEAWRQRDPRKIRILCEIIASAGGSIDASHCTYSWLNWFCDDDAGSDIFNQAIELGYIRTAHDSDTDSSTAYLTDGGRAWLAEQPS